MFIRGRKFGLGVRVKVNMTLKVKVIKVKVKKVKIFKSAWGRDAIEGYPLWSYPIYNWG